VIELNRAFLERALESLRGARIEYDGGRHNNSVNRSYYACFQAAIYALQMEGIHAFRGDWGHDFVQSQFNGQLIHRRHRYPTSLSSTLSDNLRSRLLGDYNSTGVSDVVASRALHRAERFVAAIVQRHEEQS
jgi:uncharacterized protein (UPF0332 family)